MNALDTYMFVIDLIAKLAINSWDEKLPHPYTLLTNPEYPDLSLAAAATSERTRLPQKYLFWGLARVMERLTRLGFVGGAYDLLVQGRRVGSFTLISGSLSHAVAGNLAIDSGLNQVVNPTALTQSANSIPIVSDETVTWTHEFGSRLLTPADVLMPAIGSLISAAEQYALGPQALFIGYFKPYRALFAYRPSSPAVWTKVLCINTIVIQVTYARDHSNWHEQKSQVENGTGIIASGGYFPIPLADIGGFLNVSTS